MFSYFIRHGTKARMTYETYILYGSVLFQVALISLRIWITRAYMHLYL